MEAAFWHDRWETNQIGFHQSETNSTLRSRWKELQPTTSQVVLAPLCGKSQDLVWLAQQGHTVIGVELSPIAIQDFFGEANLGAVEQRTEGAFDVSSAGNIHLYCGNIFDLRLEDLPSAPTLIYDRAALIALPFQMRSSYLNTINQLAPSGTKMMLLSLSYPESEMAGPPFSIPAELVHELYGEAWNIVVEDKEDILHESKKFQDRGVSYLFEHTMILEKR